MDLFTKSFSSIFNYVYNIFHCITKLDFDILYNNESIFEGKETIRYNTILIDEIQDYNKEWIKILSRFFLKDAGEMILFGDQSQNIYHKETSTSDSLIIRGFGRWIKLTKSFRSKIDTNLVYLFKLFQE